MIWLRSMMEGVRIFGRFVFPVFALGSIGTMIHTQKWNLLQSLLQGAFLMYLCIVAALVFLPLPSAEEAQSLTYQAQLMPFHCIRDAMENPFRGTLVVVLNVCMTIPFGMFLRYYFGLNAGRVFLYSLALTTLVEFGQYTGLFFLFKGSYRLFDVDDLILNTLGGMLGYLAVKRTERFLPQLASFHKSLRRRKPVVLEQF